MTAPTERPEPGREPPVRGLFSGGVVSLGHRGLAVVLGFAFSILLARQLGAEAAGVYLLAFNAFTLLTRVGCAGLDNVVVRSVAGRMAEDDAAGMRGVIRRSTELTGLAAGAVAVVGGASAGWWAEVVFQLPAATVPFRILSFAVLPAALVEVWGQALRGLGHLGASQWLRWVSLRLLNLGGLAVIGGSYGAVGLSQVTAGAALVTALGASVWLWVASRRGPVRPVAARELVTPALTLFVVSVLTQATGQLSIYFLAPMAGGADAGIFGVAFRTAAFLSLFLHAVNVSIGAPAATLHRRGQVVELARIARNATTVLTWIAPVVLVVMVAVREPIMTLFGEEFRVGAPAFAILAVGQAVSVMAGPSSVLLTMSHREALQLRIAVVMLVVTVALNLVLVPALGLVGAAVSTSVAAVVLKVVEIYVVRRELGFWLLSTPFRLERRVEGP